jgi:hypothetical protein
MTGSLKIGRWDHSAILLPNGKVLVVGGEDKDFNFLASGEIFDPATGQWSATGSLGTGLSESTLTLLPNGKVLAEAGFITRTSELFDVGLGFTNSAQPKITSITSPLNLGSSLAITGSTFRGMSESSGGNGSQASSSDCPVVQLRNLETGQVQFLSAANWQTNSLVSLPVTNFPPGYALATISVNGIPSDSRILLISAALPTLLLVNPINLPDGSFQFSFIHGPGGNFTVLAANDLSLPLSNWTMLGSALEISAGHFQFTDAQAQNQPRRFYRVRFP